MRHHFHRCLNLRVITVDAADLSHSRKGGSLVLEELCEAKQLAPCLGLVDCDVLAPAQKRELLGARATRLREEEGGRSALVDGPDPRREELEELRLDLQEEYEEIVQENRQRSAEAAAAVLRNPRPLRPDEEHELAGAGVGIFLDEELVSWRTARLDALERALDAIARGRYGDCLRCRQRIDVKRLRASPDTVVCDACAREALPE